MRASASLAAVFVAIVGCGGEADVHHGAGMRDAGHEPPAMHGTTPSPTGDAGMPMLSGAPDICGNGLDDDFNGVIDDGCRCVPGVTQPCYPGDPADLVVGPCASGTQTCAGTGEFGTWGSCDGALLPSAEVCTDGVDNDCNGVIDDGCPPPPPPPPPGPMTVTVTVSLDGDCLTASCPPEAPYPVGCAIMMAGGDSRGCIASTPTTSEVYFQEGDACGAGHVSGTLTCATAPGAGLNASDCMINKPEPMYPSSPDGCPDTWF